MRSTGYAVPFISRWLAVIGAFQSSLFWREVVPSVIHCCTVFLLCFLMVGIHASGISIPLSLLMLSGWSLMWIASLTLRVYQWGSRSINRDIWLARTQTSAVSEHAHKTGHYPLWNEVKFIDRDPHWYTRRVKEAIHIRLHPDNINRDNGIEIPEAWMPTIKKHNRKTVQQRITGGTTSRQNSEDRNAPITANQRDINGTA